MRPYFPIPAGPTNGLAKKYFRILVKSVSIKINGFSELNEIWRKSGCGGGGEWR
jgi:hypothetical protein